MRMVPLCQHVAFELLNTHRRLSMNPTLTRPAATLSHPMGEGLGVRAHFTLRGSIREVLLGRILALPALVLWLIAACVQGSDAPPPAATETSSPPCRVLVLFDAPRVAYGLGNELEFLELQLRRTGALVQRAAANSIASNQLPHAERYVLFCPQPEPQLPAHLLQQLIDSKRPVWWIGFGIAAQTLLPPGVGRADPWPTASYRLRRVQYAGRVWDLDEAAWIPVRRIDDAASSAQVLISPADVDSDGKGPALCWKDGPWTFFSAVPASGRLGWLFSELVLDFCGAKEQSPSRVFLRLDDYQAGGEHAEFLRKVDLLAAKGRPFAVTVTPSWRLSPTGAVMNLDSAPEFVESLRYAQSRGGRLLMRGCLRDGERAEYWDEELDRPVDKLPGAVRRELEAGVRLMLKHGLLPVGWQTPHDAAPQMIYQEIGRVFATSVERPLLSDLTQHESGWLSCLTYDRAGRRIVPENLGFLAATVGSSLTNASNGPVTGVALLRTNAAWLGALSATVASAYFHAYLPHAKLAELLDALDEVKKPYLDLLELDNWVHIPGRVLLTGRAERKAKLAGGVLTWKAFDRFGRLLLTQQEFALTGERVLQRKGKGAYELYEFAEANP